VKAPRLDPKTAARLARAAVFLIVTAGCEGRKPPPPPDLPAVGGQVSLLRFPGGGGVVQSYHPDSLTVSSWASQSVPAIRRALGVNLDERLLWALDTQGNLVGIDLETRLVRRRLAGVIAGSVGPDGSLYVVDSSHHIVRMAQRDAIRFHDPLPAAPRALYPAVNDQVVAVTGPPARVITASADQVAHSAAVSTGDVSATTWGDLVAIANDSGVVLYETGGQHSRRWLEIRRARRVGFSPSGHRLFVSQQDQPRLRVYDRFTLTELPPLQLPGTPKEFRVDASGRWMMVHREAGDTIWIADMTTGRIAGAALADWGPDLPLVAGASTLVIRQGDDVVSLDLRQATPRETARLNGGGRDFWQAISWVPPERIPAAVAAAESASVAQDSALVTGVTPVQPDSIVMYLQVSRTQNEEWASLLMKQLQADGFPASILPPAEPEDGYRVVVGPYPLRETADSVGRAMGRPYFLLRLPAKKP
jgi:hypothetical protein